MSSDCPITEDEIGALVDGELTGREQRRVAAHVLTCEDCSAQAGGVLAAKRLLSARGQPIEPPASLWERVSKSLDVADGLARASSGSRSDRPAYGLAPRLAIVGLVLIVGALAWRSHVVGEAGTGELFVRAHMAACARAIGTPSLPNVSDVVAPSVGADVWEPVQRTVFSLDGQFVEHVLYRVNRTPISEFVVATRAFDASGLSLVRYDGAIYLVRGEPGGSVVAWEAGGVARVLVGRVKAPELLYLAAARRLAVPAGRVY